MRTGYFYVLLITDILIHLTCFHILCRHAIGVRIVIRAATGFRSSVSRRSGIAFVYTSLKIEFGTRTFLSHTREEEDSAGTRLHLARVPEVLHIVKANRLAFLVGHGRYLEHTNQLPCGLYGATRSTDTQVTALR